MNFDGSEKKWEAVQSKHDLGLTQLESDDSAPKYPSWNHHRDWFQYTGDKRFHRKLRRRCVRDATAKNAAEGSSRRRQQEAHKSASAEFIDVSVIPPGFLLLNFQG